MTLTQEPTTREAGERRSAVEARPVAGFIGAEISGVDLTGELTDQEVADIRSALVRHKVIFFRDQHISPEQQVAFGRLFGEITAAHPTLPPSFPQTLPVSSLRLPPILGGARQGRTAPSHDTHL